MMETHSPHCPADLTKILNPNYTISPISLSSHSSTVKSPDDLRDSAYFSSNDVCSNETSSASYSCGGIQNPVNSVLPVSDQLPSPISLAPSPTEKIPLPITLVQPPGPHVAPTTAGTMSVASIMSPTSPPGLESRRFDHYTSSGPQNGLAFPPDSSAFITRDPRRESVDSRVNQRFDDMTIGNTPFTSHHPSTSSFQHISTAAPAAQPVPSTSNGAQRPARPVAVSLDIPSLHRISNGYQPSTDRIPKPRPKVIKTAPAITGPTTSTIARAAEPIKGQAWAFPEEDMCRIETPNHYLDSRRSSVADSLAGTQFTTVSGRLPPGQRPLDDGDFMHGNHYLPRHYSQIGLQQDSVGDLLQYHHHILSPDCMGQQLYSRTPELRVSHKLAERKRRSELKKLFDQLRDVIPQERGSKASKWEILTKAISEILRQAENVRGLSQHLKGALSEIDMLRLEAQSRKAEVTQMRPDSRSTSNYHHQQQTPPYSGPSQPTSLSDLFSSRTDQLPPMRSINGSLPSGSESMTGLQYGIPRSNGLRS